MKKTKLLIVLSISGLLVIGIAVIHRPSLALVPGNNELASLSSSDGQGNADSSSPSSSRDGRYIAFTSAANNLVGGDTNNKTDVFVRDRTNNTISRVSVSSSGAEGDGDSAEAKISNDGRYVTFYSNADNLVSGDTNSTSDIFVRDTQNNTTTLVSTSSSGVIGNANSQDPAISADGRFVTFDSYASNLTSSDTNGHSDVFAKDVDTGATTLVSKTPLGGPSNDDSWTPSISCDGGVIAFNSYASNLVSGDTNASGDIFIDIRAANDELSDVTKAANNSSGAPVVSCDGNFVGFGSSATNLVSGDTNAQPDVFEYDRMEGNMQRVSVATSSTQGNDITSGDISISGDGRYMTFDSAASNLISSDTNGKVDVFLHDLVSGSTQAISINSGATLGNGNSFVSSISADGKVVSFESVASNLISNDTNGVDDIFVGQTGN